MIKWVGPVGVPKTLSESPVKAHPVDTVEPSANVPLLAMLISCPELAVKVPLVAPPLNVNAKSLIAWATSVMFACRLLSMIVTVPAPVVTIADALTGPPLVVLPAGVVKRKLFA